MSRCKDWSKRRIEAIDSCWYWSSALAPGPPRCVFQDAVRTRGYLRRTNHQAAPAGFRSELRMQRSTREPVKMQLLPLSERG